MSMRIGHGVDYHRLADGDGVRLAGVDVPCGLSIVAHSDGDVILHALCDALLGALALGDIGRHFPDSDARWRGADSRELTAAVMAMVRERGWRVVNADLTLIAQRPRVAAYIPAMRESIAGLLGIALDAASVKATTPEGMDAIGAGQGICAHAVVLLERFSVAAPPQGVPCMRRSST